MEQHAEVRSAVKLHHQEVSFSVPRYRVLQMHWSSFPEEENQLRYRLISLARNYTSQFICIYLYTNTNDKNIKVTSPFSNLERDTTYNKPEVKQLSRFTLRYLGLHFYSSYLEVDLESLIHKEVLQGDLLQTRAWTTTNFL